MQDVEKYTKDDGGMLTVQGTTDESIGNFLSRYSLEDAGRSDPEGYATCPPQRGSTRITDGNFECLHAMAQRRSGCNTVPPGAGKRLGGTRRRE